MTRQRFKLLALVALFIAPGSAAALADDAAPVDKSSYTVFNPVPDNQLRDFQTDRPAKANSAQTVDAGHIQYESDILSWTYDRYSTTRQTTSNLIVFDPVVKLGLTSHTDLEIALAPININHGTERTSDSHSNSFGFGDVYTRMKFNILGNDGGTFELAVVPFIKLPTAPVPVGNGHFEGGGYVPFTINLPDQFAVTLETELDMLENAANTGARPNYQNLINVSRPITDTVSGQIEFWSDVNTDVSQATQYTFDAAATWAITKNMQFDLGTNVGLNKAAPDLQIYTGISQRF